MLWQVIGFYVLLYIRMLYVLCCYEQWLVEWNEVFFLSPGVPRGLTVRSLWFLRLGGSVSEGTGGWGAWQFL